MHWYCNFIIPRSIKYDITISYFNKFYITRKLLVFLILPLLLISARWANVTAFAPLTSMSSSTSLSVVISITFGASVTSVALLVVFVLFSAIVLFLLLGFLSNSSIMKMLKDQESSSISSNAPFILAFRY